MLTGIKDDQNKPIESHLQITLNDVAKDKDANKVGNILTFAKDSKILAPINEPMIMDFNLVLKDGVTLYINQKVTGKGTIYIEDGATVDARWSPLGVRVVSFKKGKLVL